MDYKAREWPGLMYTLQVAPEDCTGCTLCVEVCPAKDKSNPRCKAINMEPQAEHRERERHRYAFFLTLLEADRTKVKLDCKGTEIANPALGCEPVICIPKGALGRSQKGSRGSLEQFLAREPSSSSRCSSTRERARDATKRPTSSC